MNGIVHLARERSWSGAYVTRCGERNGTVTVWASEVTCPVCQRKMAAKQW